MTSGPPVVRADMIVDAGCSRRMARAATLSAGRVLLALFAGLLPGIVGSLLVYPRSADIDLGDVERLVVSGLVGFGVWAAVSAVYFAVVLLLVRPRLERLYAVLLPVGSHLQVDYYADRMIATSAGGAVRETPYATLGRVRRTSSSVAFARGGRGSGVLPIEVVPPLALTLLTTATRPARTAR